jgi:hypothetical protein
MCLLVRLHLRYSRETFPQDLMFQSTANRQLFQGRYVITHPYRGEMKCPAAEDYTQNAREQQEREVQNLAELTDGKLRIFAVGLILFRLILNPGGDG